MERFVRQMIMILVLPIGAILDGNVWGQKSLPYTYGFENNDLASEGWTTYNCVSNAKITQTSGYYRTGSYGFDFYWTTNPPEYLISPSLSLTEDDITVEFYYKSQSSGAFTEIFQVGYSTVTNSVTDFIWNDEINVPPQSNQQWHQYLCTFPSGTKYVSIRLNSNDQYHLCLDDFSVTSDSPQITPPEPEPQEWTKCYTFEDNIIPSRFENDETYPWTIVSNDPNHVSYCLKSGNGGIANSTATISIDVEYESNGLINFNGGIYGEGSSDSYDWDKCRFYIDEVLKFDYGAHGRWENFEYEVSAGTHNFKWVYKKDGSVNPTGDAFFIDDLCFDADMFLPITLLSFTVTANPEGNLLEWVTATEEHNAGFKLERSTNATDWTDFAWVQSNCSGNSIENTHYSFLDHNPPSDTTYYRFEQIDSTSSSVTYYSDIVVAMREPVASKIMPSVYYDNAICLVGIDRICDAYVYYPDGRIRYDIRLKPYETRRLNIYGYYIIEMLWVEDGDLQRKCFKVFSY